MSPEREHGSHHHRSHDSKKDSVAHHIPQSHLELIVLTKLFRSTGGCLATPGKHSASSSMWKHQTGWDDVFSVSAALLNGEMILSASTTMQSRFPHVHGVKWERNHVVAIDLSGNGLAGKLPPEIAQLRFLTTLKLRDNPRLRGPLPPAMHYRMQHLRYCYLDGTRLENVLPVESAHSFHITQVHTTASRSPGSALSTVRFITGDNSSGNRIRWMVDMTEAEMFMLHSSLKKLHEAKNPEDNRRQIKCTAQNATGPERAAAATKLQRIYRARIERTKFRNFLHSLVEKQIDPATGCTYYVNARTGESTWEKPAFLKSSAEPLSDVVGEVEAEKSVDINSVRDDLETWQPYDDGNGNTYYWNSVTGESTWEPPVFLSRIYEELRNRYGSDKTNDERFELFFQDIDRDGTGEIDKDEFARLCGDLGMAMSSKQIGEVFCELDISGNGQLDREEIITWLTRNYT